MKNFKLLLILLFSFILIFPMVSAGVGISWDKESALVQENTKTCLTYKIYNPWPEESYVKIELSNSLLEILKSSDSNVEFIPAETSSSEAIPVTFCFKTPTLYEKDCALFDTFFCKQECLGEQIMYSGEVEVLEVPKEMVEKGGAGGSATAMSVSAPLRVRVMCVAHGTSYTPIYVLVGLIVLILLIGNLLRGKNKKESKKENKKFKKEKSK